MTLEELTQEFITHRHTGVDTQQVELEDTLGYENLLPYSFPLLTSLGDSTLNIHTDDINHRISYENANATLQSVGGAKHFEARASTSDWASIDNIWGGVIIGNYAYVLFQDNTPAPDEWRIYRYNINDLSAGGTQCTFSGTAPTLTTNESLRMASDGQYLYLNYNGGNSANAWVIAKYSVSGTVLTYYSSTTCGSATSGFNNSYAVLKGDLYYTIDTTNRNISKFDATGTLVYTDSANTLTGAMEKFSNIENVLYCYNANSKQYEKMIYT